MHEEEVEETLEEWIARMHPPHTAEYMGRTFTFDYDLPSSKLIKYGKLEGMERTYFLLAETSIEPKQTFDQVKAWPSNMLANIHNQIKKAIEISQNPSIESTSLPESSINPSVKSETGGPMLPSE